MVTNKNEIALITGSAGFIGFHVAKKLLKNNCRVIGVDCLSNYYDVNLKIKRESILKKYSNYRSINANIEENNLLMSIFKEEQPQIIIHLAAQAGVRYSIENPRAYLNSNIIGTFELLEACRSFPPKHMLFASTSSAYGFNETLPFTENQRSDHQMSFYAATKKSTESMAHSYSHLFNLPTTVFRFFTVYGPWGRPDMALFKFTEAILNNESLDVYNNGHMKRDFTFIDDLVTAIELLIEKIPDNEASTVSKFDSLSPIAPYRLVNIGNSKSIKLIDFIKTIEQITGKTAIKNFMPMQSGDVPSTLAKNQLLRDLTNFSPQTDLYYGVKKFINWYKDYYD